MPALPQGGTVEVTCQTVIFASTSNASTQIKTCNLNYSPFCVWLLLKVILTLCFPFRELSIINDSGHSGSVFLIFKVVY